MVKISGLFRPDLGENQMDSQGLVRSKGKRKFMNQMSGTRTRESEEGRNVGRPKWCRTCLLSAFLILCGAVLSLNYISIDFWSFIVKTWTQWGRVKGQESGTAQPRGTSTPTTLKSTTTQAPWKPLGPFEILYPHKYHFILDEPEKCRNQCPFLVLVVPVAPHNRAARDTIRRTWDLLVNTLLDPHAAQPKEDYITGAVIRNGLVQRQKGTKWYVPEEVFPQETYPCYVSGNAYAFSMDLSEKILRASRHVRAFHLEDVYLGMCLEHLGILPTDPPQPGLFYLWQIPYNRCKFSGIVSITGFSLNKIDRYWSDFQKPGPPC
ncbi:beta-1,3-galactosyltransferase 1-like [Scleropages formosus]|uniref:Hexosyltransferase n=1 Tax=Scleropages formosus TaxID=113540 RepID=A0A0P7XVP6_SCLFO|nr:beta-1,3-galactosyltransferase 1-like [Scleropages formosus]